MQNDNVKFKNEDALVQSSKFKTQNHSSKLKTVESIIFSLLLITSYEK